MAQIELITVDPNICHGQACIRGTRIPASVILDCLAAGMTPAEITGQYPSVDAAGIRAALAYGALLAREEIRPLPEFAD